MTNAKISKTARAVLRNKAVASAIAKALATKSQKGGLVVKVDGKEYTIKTLSSLTDRITFQCPGIKGESP